VITTVRSCPRLSYHAAATRVTFVKTQTASTTAAHDGQGRSSREQPNGDDDPFPVQEATEQIAHPLQPAIFLPK
jgi:hypothetical protein